MKAYFTIDEKRGNLPYVVMWVGKHNLPSVEHFATLIKAKKKVDYLKVLNLQPTLLLDVHQTEQIRLTNTPQHEAH